jgi:hypothetical protein
MQWPGKIRLEVMEMGVGGGRIGRFGCMVRGAGVRRLRLLPVMPNQRSPDGALQSANESCGGGFQETFLKPNVFNSVEIFANDTFSSSASACHKPSYRGNLWAKIRYSSLNLCSKSSAGSNSVLLSVE